jgi:hypothetical protein
MASWGEFIKEIPIINKRSEGMFVKVDHVLDLWEERNKLRRELALLQSGGSGGGASEEELQAAAAAEREVCASEIESMAEALAEEPEPNQQLITMLNAVARLLREKGADDAEDAEAPMAEPLDNAVEDAPMAEPLEAVDAPLAEPLDTPEESPPMAEPVAEDAAPAAPTLADLLNRQRASS